jgi:hypothetical protein
VVVSDEGSSYRVSVTGEGTTAQKTYRDPGRECARRTRFAAVFAILTLMPPELEPEPMPEPEATPEPEQSPQTGAKPGSSASSSAAAKPSGSEVGTIDAKADATASGKRDEADESSSTEAKTARPRPMLRFEFVGLGEQALGVGEEPRIRSLGIELRALLARGDFAPLLALGYAPSAELDAGVMQVEVRRMQASLGFRAHTELGPMDLGGELALLGALERIAGIGLEHTARGNGFELGFRVGALLSLASGRVGPLVAFHASVFPTPNGFEALPRGEAGHMPHLWLGLSAGAFLGL